MLRAQPDGVVLKALGQLRPPLCFWYRHCIWWNVKVAHTENKWKRNVEGEDSFSRIPIAPVSTVVLPRTVTSVLCWHVAALWLHGCRLPNTYGVRNSMEPGQRRRVSRGCVAKAAVQTGCVKHQPFLSNSKAAGEGGYACWKDELEGITWHLSYCMPKLWTFLCLLKPAVPLKLLLLTDCAGWPHLYGIKLISGINLSFAISNLTPDHGVNLFFISVAWNARQRIGVQLEEKSRLQKLSPRDLQFVFHQMSNSLS